MLHDGCQWESARDRGGTDESHDFTVSPIKVTNVTRGRGRAAVAIIRRGTAPVTLMWSVVTPGVVMHG